MKVGPYELEVVERVLLLADQSVAMPPKAIEVLIALVSDTGRVVSKEALMERVWPDTFVDEANLTQSIYRLRRQFARDGSSVRIENVPRRGYRLIAIPLPATEPATRLCRQWPQLAAALVAVLLGCTVSGSSWRTDGGAYALAGHSPRDYLLGRNDQSVGSETSLHRAARLFSAVVRAGPNNALGYAGRAETEASLSFYAQDSSDRIDLQARAIDDARAAVEKGNYDADAFAALGAVEMSIEHDAGAAERALTRALAANPNHLGALVWRGTLLMEEGRIGEARVTFARAMGVAPNAAGTAASLAWSDFLAGDDADAIALSRQMLLANQLPVVARVTLANAGLDARDFTVARSAIEELARSPETRVQAGALAARLNAMTGRAVAAAAELDRLARVDPREIGDWDAASMAAAYVSLGDRRRAYLWLDRVGLWGRRETARDPRFAALARDPRFGRWVRAG